MRNIVDANFYLDIGGVESPTAINVTREPNGSERLFVEATIPNVDENIVVIARVQKGPLQGLKFLNVINDNGIDDQVLLDVTPSNKVLTGTEISALGLAPDAMADFSDASTVTIYESETGLISSQTTFGKTASSPVDNSGGAVFVEGVLRDKSGNEKASSITVEKLAYLSDLPREIYFEADTNESIDFALNAVASNQALIIGINRLDGGHRIVNSMETLVHSEEGQIISLQNSRTGLVVHVIEQGAHRIDFYEFKGDGLGPVQSTSFHGELIASNGNVIWVRHGELISTMTVTPDGFVLTPGINLQEPIISHGSAWSIYYWCLLILV